MVTADVATYNRVSSRNFQGISYFMIERFIDAAAGGMAGTPLTAGATVVSASDLVGRNAEIQPQAYTDFTGPWEGLDVAAEDVSLVVPAGAGAESDDIKPQNVMAMVSGTAMPGSKWLPGKEWMPGSKWLPGKEWMPGSATASPGVPDYDSPGVPDYDSQWLPGREWIPDEPRSLHVYLTSGEEPRPELFGQDTLPGDSLEEGEEVSVENAVLAAPLDVFFEGEGPTWNPEEVHGIGRPAPLGGRTFGMSVASTPDREFVLNQDLFAVLADSSGGGEFVLNQDLFAMLGRDFGNNPPAFTRAAPDSTNLAPGPTNLLGTDTEIRSFLGSLEGPAGVSFGLAIHAARVETQDGAVIAVGTHNWPVGSAGQSPAPEVGGLLEAGQKFFGTALQRLDFEDQVAAQTPTPAPTPGPDGDRLSGTLRLPPKFLNKTEQVTVSEQSEFSISFESLTACSMDIAVVPGPEYREWGKSDDGSGRPEEIRESLRSLARDHAPEELRFFGASSGSGAAELSHGAYQIVFTRACELGTRTAVDFTAEVEAGEF